MENHINNDHDLLIELRTEMRGMREDLKTMSDGVSLKITDHETRLRSIEKLTDNLNMKLLIGGVLLTFVGGIVSAVIIGLIKKGLGI